MKKAVLYLWLLWLGKRNRVQIPGESVAVSRETVPKPRRRRRGETIGRKAEKVGAVDYLRAGRLCPSVHSRETGNVRRHSTIIL